MNKQIAIIGCGNLGLSITQGLLQKIDGKQITVTRHNIDAVKFLEKDGVRVTSSNCDAVAGADVVLLAVKPYLVTDVLTEISSKLTDKHIVVSLATGVALSDIESACPSTMEVIRVMPNIAAAVGESASCISKGSSASSESLATVKQIFDLIGTSVVIDENLMESATVLAGCGTAFVLRFIRAMVEAGVQIGFKPDVATLIANQTVKGAAQILLCNGNHPEAELDKVTTPKGVTITALNEMERNGFSSSVIQGMLKAYDKIVGK